MIRRETLPTPKVLQELDYETILERMVSRAKELVPGWEPLESDDFKIILEDLAYNEMHLRATWNDLAKGFFLAFAEGSDLDNIALFYGIERLQGAKPYTNYTFTLSDTLGYDVTIPKGLVLQDSSHSKSAILLEDVVVPAGILEGVGVVELQEMVDESSIRIENITTPLPFVVSAVANEKFKNGANVEDDESLRERILLSMADKSTAGSEESYKSYVYKADARVSDVNVINGGSGVVEVYYYSDSADDIMQQRIESMLNGEMVRPISDDPHISLAEEVHYSISAKLHIYPNLETSSIYTSAIESLKKGLEKLKRIGTTITLSEINDFLRIDGVKKVEITMPTEDIVINNNQIGINDESNNTITYTII